MKKFLALTMALCMIFAMCAFSASADEPITLTYAEVNPRKSTPSTAPSSAQWPRPSKRRLKSCPAALS